MWVTKLLISPVKKRVFSPKATKLGPKLAVLVILAQAIQCPVGGCDARAESRKTPIYFIALFSHYKIKGNQPYHTPALYGQLCYE